MWVLLPTFQTERINHLWFNDNVNIWDRWEFTTLIMADRDTVTSVCDYVLYVFLLSALSVTTWIPKTLSKCLNNIKAALLWLTPAVVIESWHYFTAWFYHSHQNLNREISGPSESDKSQRNCTVSLAAVVAARIPAMIQWFTDLESQICTM